MGLSKISATKPQYGAASEALTPSLHGAVPQSGWTLIEELHDSRSPLSVSDVIFDDLVHLRY